MLALLLPVAKRTLNHLINREEVRRYLVEVGSAPLLSWVNG